LRYLRIPTDSFWRRYVRLETAGVAVLASRMKPTRGRPSLPKHRRKSITLCARTDERTYRQFKRAASSAGMRFTDWVRINLKAAADRDLAL